MTKEQLNERNGLILAFELKLERLDLLGEYEGLEVISYPQEEKED